MKRYLPFLIIVVVAASAIASGNFIYRAKLAELAATTSAAPAAGTASAGAKSPHVRGEAKATVTLEEFGDFQCPPCAMLSRTLEKVEHDYGAKLRVVFRQFPLAMHKHAMRAACSAEAAGLQGRFWDMHDVLYRNQNIWAQKGDDVADLFLEYARSIGLDEERFKRDVDSEEVKERVRADQQRGTSLGVGSTPTVFVNNVMLQPASLAEPALRVIIDDAIAGKNPTPAAKPTPVPSPPATTSKP